MELAATLAAEPLYTTYGFRALKRVTDATGGAPVPIVMMEKPIELALRPC